MQLHLIAVKVLLLTKQLSIFGHQYLHMVSYIPAFHAFEAAQILEYSTQILIILTKQQILYLSNYSFKSPRQSSYPPSQYHSPATPWVGSTATPWVGSSATPRVSSPATPRVGSPATPRELLSYIILLYSISPFVLFLIVFLYFFISLYYISIIYLQYSVF